MIKSIKTTVGVSLTLLMSLMVSCSNQDDLGQDLMESGSEDTVFTYNMVLNVNKSGFDDETKTRAVPEWQNGDKIYLIFNGNPKKYGTATYSGSAIWSVECSDQFKAGDSNTCTAVYFDNPEYESGSSVRLTEKTGIYEDEGATYTFDGESLSVSASLSPKTGRIRFKGTKNQKMQIYGLSHYTAYDTKSGVFSSNSEAISTSVTTDYTPYIYGSFADSESPRLNVITPESGFTRRMPVSVFQKGQSGYMNVPTPTAYSGWTNSVDFKIKGVEFTMIPVKYSDGNFLLAETETTEELYAAIMNMNPTTSKLPKSQLESSSWVTFINQLNVYTGINFRLPSVDEWKYAFKGGEKSKGYTYSGSNNISQVAWYRGNSNGTRHPVKQLQPNELGFYDMSGNLSEINKSGNYIYGGYYNSDDFNCQENGTYYSASTYSFGGLRIALSFQ